MDCRITSINKAGLQVSTAGRKRARQAGLSIAELIMSVGIAALVLAQVCLLWLYSSRSFAAQMSYADMDQRSQRALDTLTQNIRQCKELTSYTSNSVTFLDYDNKPLTFTFDGGKLTRTKLPALPKVLLKDCMEGQFAIYMRTPVAGAFDHYETTDPTLCKLV